MDREKKVRWVDRRKVRAHRRGQKGVTFSSKRTIASEGVCVCELHASKISKFSSFAGCRVLAA